MKYMRRKVQVVIIIGALMLVASCLNVGTQIASQDSDFLDGGGLTDAFVSGKISKVEIKGPFNIVFFNGKGLSSNMSETFLERVEFSFRRGVLRITPSRRFFPYPSDQLIIYLGTSDIEEVTLQIDGKVTTTEFLIGKKLALNFLGNVSGVVNSDIDDLRVTSRSSGRIILVGSAKRLETKIYASAVLSLRNFRVQELLLDNDYGSQVLMPK